MTKIQYLRLLHDIAYQANLADTDVAHAWQTPDMAATHAQPVLDIARSMLTPDQYQAFLDCFGDFASFASLLEPKKGRVMFAVTFTHAGEEMRRWTGFRTIAEARAAVRDSDAIIPFSWQWRIAAE